MRDSVLTDRKHSQSGGFGLPWPLAGDGPLSNRCEEGDRLSPVRSPPPGAGGRPDGDMSAMRNENRNMSTDHCSADRSGLAEPARLAKLSEARELMAAALLLLDRHSSSPAAATLDLAVHHLDGELAG